MKKIALKIMLVVGLIVYSTSTLSASARSERVDEHLSISDGTRIFLDISSADITVGTSPDNQVHITYYNTIHHEYEITQNGNELVLKQNILLWIGWDFSKTNRSVSVLIPKQFAGALSIENSSGSNTLENISLQSIDIDSSSGRINVERVSTQGDISIKGSSGSIMVNDVTSTNGVLHVEGSSGSKKIYNASATSIDLSSNSGSIKAEQLSSQGDIRIKVSSGSITLNDATSLDGVLRVEGGSGSKNLSNISANTIHADSFSGKINLEHIECTDINITVTSGGTEFTDLNAQNITIESFSGRVRGNIVGKQSDFSVISRSGSGSNNLPSDWTGVGNKTLNVSVTSGSIKVEFTE